MRGVQVLGVELSLELHDEETSFSLKIVEEESCVKLESGGNVDEKDISSIL